jgi:asparagine synthase (glutamine-hydrolysing)
MTDFLRHRGPDDAGVEIASEDPLVAFGHRRLSIIDLSAAGHQPMHDPDADTWLTFNGEIYNFLALRSQLEAAGQQFRTRTDTEVILKAYAAWGPECVKRLRGIFAFGIWDGRARTLLLARDQLGVKPMYYWHGDGVLAFASEVRSILAAEIAPRKLDRRGLCSFLAYGSVQEPYTLVEGIESLLPGHFILQRMESTHTERYWQLPSAESVEYPPPKDLLEKVEAKLEDAVSGQLVGDVPLGAFLSGGIDSTAIAALVQRKASRPTRTFSIVFEEKQYDERTYSRLAARHLGTDHTELLLRGSDVRNSLSEALAAFDQPSMDGLNTYFVSRITKEAGLTVALSGVGGDELFGGYDAYRKALLAEKVGRRIHHLPAPLRHALAAVVYNVRKDERFRRLADLLQTNAHPYFLSRQVLGPRQVEGLLDPDVDPGAWMPARFDQLESETSAYDSINRASAFELQTYMLSTLLRDSDQMSMAHALEVRVPLIDHELVEFMFTLPGACKVDRAHPKPLLTKTLQNDLPYECVYRPKRGFELPFSSWLRESLLDEMHASLAPASVAEAAPFRPESLRQLWTAFESGEVGWSRVWAVFVLRHWLREHRIQA